MSFLNPIAFWGLLSLLVPLIIHLLSKKQKNIFYFGSNRFLTDQETTSASSIQLSDYKLLFLRLGLLGLLILALAQLAKPDTTIDRLTYIEYELSMNNDYQSILPEIDQDETIKYFSYNDSEKSDLVEIFPSGYTLIHHLNQSKDSISVYTHSLNKNFLGTQIKPNKNIDWNILPLKETDKITAVNKEPLAIEILSSTKSNNHEKDIKNVLSSLSEYLPFALEFNNSSEWKILIDTTNKSQATNTIYWDTSNPVFSFDKNFESYIITGSLGKKAMLDSNFPLDLSQTLIASRTRSNDGINKTLDPQQIRQTEIQETLNAELPKSYHSYSTYLWLLVALLLLAERYFSLRTINK